ncbi:MAG: hypothetical protein QW524_03590 [Candidatus Woesearchaeota archaeon]
MMNMSTKANQKDYPHEYFFSLREFWDLLEKKETFDEISSESVEIHRSKYGTFFIYLISYLIMVIPLGIRYLFSNSFVPSKSFFLFSDLSFLFSPLGKRVFLLINSIAYWFGNPEIFILVCHLIFNLLFLLILYEVFKRFKVNHFLVIVVSSNYLLLKYALLVSSSWFSLFFFFAYFYLMFGFFNNLEKISSIFHRIQISLSYVFLMFFFSFYLLISSFSLNPLMMFFFLLSIVYLARFNRKYAPLIYLFLVLVLVFYFLIDFRYFYIDNFERIHDKPVAELLNYYLEYWKLFLTSHLRDLLIVKGFVYNFEEYTFLQMISSLRMNFPELFRSFIDPNIKIELGEVIVKTYNLYSYVLLLYEFIFLTPGIIYFLFVIFGIISYRRYFRFITLLVFLFSFTLFDPHFFFLLGLVSVVFFIEGFRFLYQKINFKEFLKVIFVVLLFSNYVFFLRYYVELAPRQNVYFFQRTRFFEMKPIYPDERVCSDFENSFIFLNKGFFFAQSLDEFYQRVTDYSSMRTLTYGQNLELMLSDFNCKYAIFLVPENTNSISAVKNNFIYDYSKYFYKQLIEISNKTNIHEIWNKIAFDVKGEKSIIGIA